MTTAASIRKVLLLTGASGEAPGCPEGLFSDAKVTRVRSFGEAIDALKRERFDLIVSAQGDFLALERAAASQQAASALESMGQGVCIINSSGQLVYSNAAMRAFPAEVVGEVGQGCRSLFASWATPGGTPDPARHDVEPHRFPLSASNELYFEVTATPIRGPEGQTTHAVAVVWDVTRARQLSKKIDAIDGAGRDLIHLGAAETAHLEIEARIRLLEEKIRTYLHDVLNFDNYVVLLVDKKSNKLEFVLQHGMSERSQKLDIQVSPQGNGISGYVAATGRSYICGDVASDPLYLPGLDTAKSSLTVPLRMHEQTIGVFNIESDKPNAFNDEDRQFVEIFSRYIAVAVQTLELLVSERWESVDRFCEDVTSEIAGPLNDILTEAAAVMDQYISDEQLRTKLQSICDNVATIKRSIREVAQPKGGIRGLRDEPAVADPVLSGKRILVADDEEIIRETLSGVLTRLGCEVDTAADGAAAINLIDTRTYDIVLADIKMPHKNGYELFAAVKDKSPATPVLLMTGFGYDPNHSIVRARREGLAGVLFKPFKVDQLLGDLRRAATPAG